MRRASLLCLVSRKKFWCIVESFRPNPPTNDLCDVEQFCLYIIQTIKANFISFGEMTRQNVFMERRNKTPFGKWWTGKNSHKINKSKLQLEHTRNCEFANIRFFGDSFSFSNALNIIPSNHRPTSVPVFYFHIPLLFRHFCLSICHFLFSPSKKKRTRAKKLEIWQPRIKCALSVYCWWQNGGTRIVNHELKSLVWQL